jgi:hypothetical protein
VREIEEEKFSISLKRDSTPRNSPEKTIKDLGTPQNKHVDKKRVVHDAKSSGNCKLLSPQKGEMKSVL